MKKLSIFGIVLMLTFYPFATFAQEVTKDADETTNNIENENNPNEQEVEEQLGNEEELHTEELEFNEEDGEKENESSDADQVTENDESIEDQIIENEKDDSEASTEDNKKNENTEKINHEDKKKDEKVEDQPSVNAETDNDEAGEQAKELAEELIAEGSINGTTSFDEDSGMYYLDLSVNITSVNQENNKETYIVLPLPETVKLLKGSPDAKLVELDGVTEFVVKFPSMQQGSKTYRIPLIGVAGETFEAVETGMIQIVDGEYEEIGIFTGQFQIDYSAMEYEYFIDAYSAILVDSPHDTEFEMYFDFIIQNLTIDKKEGIIVDIELPKGISFNEEEDFDEDYYDVELYDDVLTFFVDDLNFGKFAEGELYVSAKSVKPAKQLANEVVIMSLYEDDGETYIESYEVPLELFVGTDEEPTKTDKPNKPAIKNDTAIPEKDKEIAETNKPVAKNDATTPKQENEDNQLGKSQEQGDTLPNTATNSYNMLFIGSVILIAGLLLMFVRNRVRN